ncbi:MAG: helix-hairpin-helix domain-containing protein [Methanothrix sp.]
MGPKTLEKLAAAGVKTALDLAGAQADDLAEKTGLKINKISSWQLAARTKADEAQSS